MALLATCAEKIKLGCVLTECYLNSEKGQLKSFEALRCYQQGEMRHTRIIYQKWVMLVYFWESTGAKGDVETPDSDSLAAITGSYGMITVLLLSNAPGVWCCACLQHWKVNCRHLTGSTGAGV